MERRELTNPIPGRIIRLDRFTGGWRSVYNGRKVLVNRELHIKLGMDLDTQFDDRREFVNRGLPEGEIGTIPPDQVIGQVRFGDQLLDQAERVISFAPFGQVKYAFTPRFQFILGGRYDRYMYSVTDRLEESRATRWMRQFSPRLGLIYQFGEQHQLYANYSHGFQPPTTSELSNRPDAQGGFHPDLQPEQIRNVEAGIRGRFGGDRFDYSIALYNMHYQDMLIPYQSPVPGIEEVFYENAGSAGNLGLEGRLRWRILPSLEYTVMFTGQRFQFQDFVTARGSENREEGSQLSGNLVPGVPPLRGFMNLTYRSEMYFAGLDFQWVDEYYANNYNGPPPDETGSRSAYRNSGYSVVDLQAGVNGSILQAGYRVGIALNNLFDHRYNSSVIPNAFGGRFFEPAPGRHWSLEVQLTLGKEGQD